MNAYDSRASVSRQRELEIAARRAAARAAEVEYAAGRAPVGNEVNLRAEEARYDRLPGEIEAQVVGSPVGDSPGLKRRRRSEAGGQIRGAQAASIRRQNALRRMMGLDVVDETATPAKRSTPGGSVVDPAVGGLQDLVDEEGAFLRLPGETATAVKEGAQRAGTYSDTPEFLSGLQSETDVQTRGAQLASRRRQDALRRRMGIQDPQGQEGTGTPGAWSPLPQ